MSLQDKHNKQDYLIRRLIAMYYDNKFELQEYKKDMRERDEGLLKISRTEKLLSGVLSTAVSRDKNRAWSLTGGSRLVSEYGRKLHSFENGSWREFISMASQNFYSTNVGYNVEIGFDSFNGIPETCWNFDPKRILLNDNDYPLVYNSKSSFTKNSKIGFEYSEFLHGNSMPSSEEEFYGLGFCAVERSLVIAKIVIGLLEYQLEKLGVAPPKGFMLIKGATHDEFEQAVADANEEMKNNQVEYYRGVLALITENTNAAIDLVAFSELPENFELAEFIDIVMQSYSLAFNYPVGQFWSIASGSFGRTGEMKVQEQQATAKGELEFSLSIQEQLQKKFLPTSVQFSFDTRNDSGDLVKTEVGKIELQKIFDMYKAPSNGQQGMLTREEARQLLAEKGFIPKEWAEQQNDIVEQDLKQIRENILSNGQLVSRIAKLPDEPIICYRYNGIDTLDNINISSRRINWRMANYLSQLDFPTSGNVSVIFESGHDAIKKKVF